MFSAPAMRRACSRPRDFVLPGAISAGMAGSHAVDAALARARVNSRSKATACAMPLCGSGWEPTCKMASRWPRHWRAPAWTWGMAMGVGGGSRWFICGSGKGQGPPDGGPWGSATNGAEQPSAGVHKLAPAYRAGGRPDPNQVLSSMSLLLPVRPVSSQWADTQFNLQPHE